MLDFSAITPYSNYGGFIAINAMIALGALLIDRMFSEFLNRAHPVVLIGHWINYFNRHWYADSIWRGAWLWLSTAGLGLIVSLLICQLLMLLPNWLAIILAMLLASTLLAHRMLFDSVQTVKDSATPQEAVAYLVSRDSKQMSEQDAYKAAMETYAENLSDGVIAPWLFLLFLGLPGMVLYKAINTLDSMVGYRTARYEKYGKVSAVIDDISNYLPARCTAILIMLSGKEWRFWRFYRNGRLHSSPNAGHPITAMALICRCRLGGPTYYFGELQNKAYFGRQDDSEQITTEQLQCALNQHNPIDLMLFIITLTLVINGF